MKFPSASLKLSWPDLASLILVVVLMVLSWFLVHGVTRGMYDQFAVLGDPPPAMGPVGEAGRNQLGHWGYFWSERAFHYRTTLMFAVDDYTSPAVLGQDLAQQYPAGVDSWREYTLLMEPVYGRLFRWFGREGEILAEFLTRLIPLLHVLMFLPLYLLARAVGARPFLAAMAVVLYATCTMGFARFSGSLLLKENFALFWLVTFLAAHFWADRRQSAFLLAASGFSLLVLLASWHLSQFLVLVMLGAVAVTQCPDRDRPGAWPVLMPAAYLLTGVLAGLTPSLLARGFLFSLTMMLVLSWLLAAVLRQRSGFLKDKPLRTLGVLAGLFLVLGSASFLNRHFTGDYNHIFGLLVHKLAHGLQKPFDPQQLPFDVRVFWAAPFTTPTWPQIWSKLGYHLFVLVPALAFGLILLLARRLDRHQQALLIMTSVLLLGWLMIERLGVVMWPVAAVAAAVAAEKAGSLLEISRSWVPGRSRQVLLLAGILTVATAGANLAGNMSEPVKVAVDVSKGRQVRIGASDEVYWGFRRDLFQWLVANTPGPFSRFGSGQAQAVLGDIGVSPQVLLYTGRPVVLNSQFENQPIRRRYQDYLAALYSSDAQRLQDFLQEVQAGYVFIDRNYATNDSPGSMAYLAGLTGPLTADLNIARLHFAPESLNFLQPVFNNEFFRVFKVGPKQKGSPTTWDRNFGNWWNLDRYTVVQGKFTDLNGDRLGLQDFENSLVALQDTQDLIMQSIAAGSPPGQPSLPELHQRYMELKLKGLATEAQDAAGPDQEKQLSRLVDAIQSRLRLPDPQSGRPLGQALAALYTRGLPDRHPGWRALMDQELAEPSHLAAAAQLLVMLGQYPQAADLMARAAACFPLVDTTAGDGRPGPEASPLVQRIRQSTVWYHLAAGRAREARHLAGSYLPFAPAGSGLEKFFREVAAIPLD